MEIAGNIVFTTVGMPYYGFDIFSVNLVDSIQENGKEMKETRHTDGIAANFNGQFIDENGDIIFVSERTGAARIFRSTEPEKHHEPVSTVTTSLFHDRPTVRNGRLFFVSAHEQPVEPFKSWTAVYSTRLDSSGDTVERLTPTGFVDLSPAVSHSGGLIAVASYGSDQWKGDFHELKTDIVVFPVSDPSRRKIVCRHGGWPAWAGDSTLFFHRIAEDGWWSIFKLDLTPDLENFSGEAERITPPGLHAFTPAATKDGKRIAVATRRKGRTSRHIEIFDVKTKTFYGITELFNAGHHHYNPFFSPESGRLGYHRFRGEAAEGDSVAPYLQKVMSKVDNIQMIRALGTFPSFSSDGKLIAINGDFLSTPGLMILRADGSKLWTILKTPGAFYTTWSPVEKGVICTSIGPIFESTKATVQIARVTFDLDDLDGDTDEVEAEVKILTCIDTGNNAFPSFSPDGKFLVFRSGRSGNKNLYIVDAVNGEGENGDGIRQLTKGDWIDTMPSWSPDGELIAFSSNRHDPSNQNVFSIYLVRPDGTELRRVYIACSEGCGDVDRERINHVCFSPDSKWLLFAANLGAVVAEPISLPNHFQPYGDLYACRLDGTSLIRLTCNGYENGTPAWHPSNVGDFGLESLSLGSVAGEKLRGQFEEPLWLTCDIK